MSESEIVKLFGGVTLKETSLKLKEEDTISSSSSLGELKSKKKNKRKKEDALRKVSSSSGLIKKKKKSNNNVGMLEERSRLRHVDWWNEERGKKLGLGTMFYGVGRSVMGTMFYAEITHPHGHLLNLGTYKTEHLAALAYDQAALLYYGPQATLNFPPPNNNN